MGTIQVIAMRMRTSHKLKMQENIASMSVTILYWLAIFNYACNEISPLHVMHVHM